MYRIQLLMLVLVGVTASADHHGDGPEHPCHMYYPNIPGEMLLDNDNVVVQRFRIEPGQWEGIHRHPANQFYFMLTPGEWTVRYGDEEDVFWSPEGEIGWNEESTELDARHQSSNSGTEPIELIWVTLKPGCMPKD